MYTQEDTDNIPDKGPSTFTLMHEISINSNGVKKLLKDLKPYKAPYLEHIVPSNVVWHLDQNNILTVKQHGLGTEVPVLPS